MSRGGKREGAGRKPGVPNKSTAEIQELARDYSPAALAELARLATGAESETARVSACNMILDRAYGKPSQSLEHTGRDGKDLIPADTSPRDLAKALLLAMAGDGKAE